MPTSPRTRRSVALPLLGAVLLAGAAAASAAPAGPVTAREAAVSEVTAVPVVGRAGDTGPIGWPDEVPSGSPFPESKRFSGVRFPGPYANYQIADTFYPSWGADGKLYTPYMDGQCVGSPGSYGGTTPASLGAVVVTGDHPLDLQMLCSTMLREKGSYDGRYASASLHKDGVWYYGSYLLDHAPPPGKPECNNYCTLGPFVGWETSTDGGLTWTPSPHTSDAPLFGEDPAAAHVRLGALHVVDFGKDMEHSPDGYAYLVGHGGGPDKATTQNTWMSSDYLYMVRVKPSPETINDPKAYEFFAGKDARGKDVWSKKLGDLSPIARWPARLGSATITYDPHLDVYLMWVSTTHDGVDTEGGPTDTMLLESDSLTGEWRMVHYLPKFGPQSYFVNTPSKFLSPGGRSWMSYSANYGVADAVGSPEGSTYTWVLREMQLVPAKDKRDKAGR